MYAYDRRPLKATVEAPSRRGQWRKETVTFDAGYGDERMQAYLFLPKNAVPPFQTVIHFPPGGGASSRQLPMRFLDFIIRSGRAVMFPVYLGTFERRGSAATGPNGERDRTIAWSKDLGRSIDYLETRRDIDRGRIAYYGFSFGGIVGPILTALEPRFKASILLGGGVVAVPKAPEIEPINFAPRVRTADADGERQTGFRETDRDAAAAALQPARSAARPEALRAVRGRTYPAAAGHHPRDARLAGSLSWAGHACLCVGRPRRAARAPSSSGRQR